MVKHVLGINSNIEALAFHNFEVFARGHVKSPSPRANYRVRMEIAFGTGSCMLENNRTSHRIAIGIKMVHNGKRFEVQRCIEAERPYVAAP